MYIFCGELVYPEPESTSTALSLLCKSRISYYLITKFIYCKGLNSLGVIILEIFELLFKHFGLLWSGIFLGVVLFISLVLLILTEEELERQDAENNLDLTPVT